MDDKPDSNFRSNYYKVHQPIYFHKKKQDFRIVTKQDWQSYEEMRDNPKFVYISKTRLFKMILDRKETRQKIAIMQVIKNNEDLTSQFTGATEEDIENSLANSQMKEIDERNDAFINNLLESQSQCRETDDEYRCPSACKIKQKIDYTEYLMSVQRFSISFTAAQELLRAAFRSVNMDSACLSDSTLWRKHKLLLEAVNTDILKDLARGQKYVQATYG